MARGGFDAEAAPKLQTRPRRILAYCGRKMVLTMGSTSVVGDNLPFGGLGLADEGEEDGGIEGEIAVEVLGIGFGIAAVVGEVMLDGFFELDFAVVDHARASSCASWRRRSSWPVTAAEMRAARYSRRRAMAEVIFAVASDVVFRSASSRSTISACSAGGGNGKRYRRSFSAVRRSE